MKLLFLSPHPDDVEIGCGATIARMTLLKHECHIAVMCGEGDLTMKHSGKTVTWSQRVAEQREAARQLGVKDVWILDAGPASKLDTVPLSKGVGALEKLLKEQDFGKMYMPLPSFNQDHQYTYDAAIAATRPGLFPYMDLLGYEQHLNFHGPQISGECRYYVQSSHEYMLKKKASLLAHESQMSGRFDENWAAIEALSKLRGFECGAPYAEMFKPIRVVR